jgi:hypothetical protein
VVRQESKNCNSTSFGNILGRLGLPMGANLLQGTPTQGQHLLKLDRLVPHKERDKVRVTQGRRADSAGEKRCGKMAVECSGSLLPRSGVLGC